MTKTSKAVLAAARRSLFEELDILLIFVVAIVTAAAQPSPALIIGAAVIGLIVLTKFGISYRVAFKINREKHVPVILGVGCSTDDFRNLINGALDAMEHYNFHERRYRKDYQLERDDFSYHLESDLPDNAKAWDMLVQSEKQLVSSLQRRLPGKTVPHFFLRCPNAFAIGLGAAFGTKHELFCHHYQPGAGSSAYFPLIELTPRTTGKQGSHILKTPAKATLIDIKGDDKATGKVYVALNFAGDDPRADTKRLAHRDSANFVGISSKSTGTILPDADWLLIAREIVTALRSLIGKDGVRNVHLFPSMPLCLAFAVGMGLDNRSAFHVHWWDRDRGQYFEVLRLNEL